MNVCLFSYGLLRKYTTISNDFYTGKLTNNKFGKRGTTEANLANSSLLLLHAS